MWPVRFPLRLLRFDEGEGPVRARGPVPPIRSGATERGQHPSLGLGRRPVMANAAALVSVSYVAAQARQGGLGGP